MQRFVGAIISVIAASIATSAFGQSSDPYPFREPMINPQKDYRQYRFSLPSGSRHTGSDLHATDSRVFAPADGIVIRIHRQTACANCSAPCPAGSGCAFGSGSCPDHGMGNVVILKHVLSDGREIFTSFNHLANIAALTVGQCVSQGAYLGTVGGSGNGCQNHWDPVHLHYEAKKQPMLGNACESAGVQPDTHYGYVPGEPDQFGFIDPASILGLPARSCAALPSLPCAVDGVSSTKEGARLMQSNDALRKECVNTPDEDDWFAFYGDRGQQVVLEAQPGDMANCGLVQLGLQRVTGTSEGAKTTVGNGTRITHTLTAPGRYLIRVRRFGFAVGEYVFTKNVLARDKGSKASPISVPMNPPVYEFINFVEDEDWYAFTLTASTAVDVAIRPQNSLMYAEQGTPLKMQSAIYRNPTDTTAVFSPSSNGQPAIIESTYRSPVLSAGTYYLKVRAFGDQTGYYSAQLTQTTVVSP